MGLGSYFEVEIDVFKEKNRIIKNYSNEELKKELARREENNIIVTRIDKLIYGFEINVYDYEDDFFINISTSSLINQIENEGYQVFDENDVVNTYNYLSNKTLAEWLGLRWWSTKEQVIDEVEKLF